MATKNHRFMISVNPRMDKQIEEFSKENDFVTQSEAIRELIRLGLAAIREEELMKDKDKDKEQK